MPPCRSNSQNDGDDSNRMPQRNNGPWRNVLLPRPPHWRPNRPLLDIVSEALAIIEGRPRVDDAREGDGEDAGNNEGNEPDPRPQ